MKKSKISETQSGKVQGYISDNKLHIFKGIPYARSPIGHLRFKPPEVPRAWDGILKTTEFGPYAPQGFTIQEESFGKFDNQDENNCLSLNIWTPEPDDEKRPVMVYIHGGSFIFGGGADIWYGVDGSELARTGNVIVVTFNYRLGALGFLYIPDVTTNVGILDQVAALKWVKDNIENFGGDPNNITIFGESAGALSVLTLVSIPLAQGLFHKAIMQSAPTFDTKTTIRSTSSLFKELGLSFGDINTLSKLKAKKIINAQNKIIADWVINRENEIMDFRPSIDGKIIPKHPIEAIENGIGKDIDILIGNNKDEIKLWTAPFQEWQDLDKLGLKRMVISRLATFGNGELVADENFCLKLIEAYKYDSNSRPIDIYDRIDTDFTFRIPAIRVCETHCQHNSKTYKYLFSWCSPALDGIYGSCHVVEIPFVFGTIGKTGVEWFYGVGKEAELLSKKMMKTWLSFAYNGTPDNELIPIWKGYDIEDRTTMYMGEEFKIVKAPFEEQRVLWDENYLTF